MTRQPARTPLTSVRDVGFYHGRHILAATFPSATTDEQYETTVGDDGHIIGCTCPGWRNHGRCWHVGEAATIAVAWYAQRHATMTDQQLAVHAEHLQRFLSHPQDQDEREAAELEAIAVRQLLRARGSEAA